MKPVKSILDPTFVYTPACASNVAQTWARYRARQDAAREKQRADIAQELQSVIQIFDARNARAKP